MAEPMRMVAEVNERELYDSVHDAAKKAQIEGDAQLQAAVAAARAPCNSDELVRLHPWSLEFDNAKLEHAYCQTMKSNWNSNCSCNDYDYVPSVIKLALTVPDFVWMLTSARRFNVNENVQNSWIGARHFWHLLVALICVTFLTVRVGAPKRYRIYRGYFLSWFILALWMSESVNIILLSHVTLWEFLAEVMAPCVYMSFLQVAPFRFHLFLRTLGFGGQIGAVLVASQFRAHVGHTLLGIAVAHCVGVGVAYFIDRRSRGIFLKALPRWLLEEVTGTNQSPLISYRADLTRHLWSILYPGLIDTPQFSDDEASACSSAAGVFGNSGRAPRRALGGFAGGFGGVSGLKSCNAMTTLHPIPFSSRSASSSDNNGDVESTSDEDRGTETNQNGSGTLQQFLSNGQLLGPRARAFPNYKRNQEIVNSSIVSPSQAHLGSSLRLRSQAHERTPPGIGDHESHTCALGGSEATRARKRCVF